MQPARPTATHELIHQLLPSGVELAADVLPERHTVALCFRMLSGLANEPAKLAGISSIVERTLSKGTRSYDGRALADAFDQRGARWGSVSGRQSTLVRVLCLPEFVDDVVALAAEMICHPTFPPEACGVAVELAQQELKHLEDEPGDLLRILIQRLTLGPVFGRYTGGTPESLARIDPPTVQSHWQRVYHAGRLQVSVAGPVDPDALGRQVDECFADLGSSTCEGREPADFEFTPATEHQHKELEQQHIGITMPGLSRDDHDFAVEQVLLGVLSGGMSSRLFTEVREKQGLVYWVAAWHEQPRGKGIIHVGASTTPERCERTYETLISELRRVGTDLTEAEVVRARDGLIAQIETEDDLTRARAGCISDDLFHFGEPRGRGPTLQALRRVTLSAVSEYARRLPLDQLCIATLGPREIAF